MLGLLTAMPVLYVCNVDEESAAAWQTNLAQGRRSAPTGKARRGTISAKIEASPRCCRRRSARI